MPFLKETSKSSTRDSITLFLYSVLFGLIVNGQALFLNVDATDSIRAYGSTQAQAASGRFLGHILDIIMENMGFYQPFRYLNVLFFIVFVAAAAVLMVSVFEIRNRLFAVLICSVILSSAAVSGTLAYFYTAHLYGLAFLMSMEACREILKKKTSLIPFLLLIASMAIYQAYLPTVILVIFVYEFRNLLSGELSVRSWILEVCRCALTCMEALAGYIALNRLYLHYSGLSISGYMNMGEDVVPVYSVREILSLIVRSYRFLYTLPFRYSYFLNDNVVMRICLGILLAGILAEIGIFVIREENLVKRMLLILLTLMLPCMINLPMFMQPRVGERFSLNWYFVLIIPIVFFESPIWTGAGKADDNAAGEAQGQEAITGAAAVLAAAMFVSLSYNIARNINIYTSYAKTHEIAEKVVLDIEHRIGACEGFDADSEVIFIGALDTESLNKYFYNVEYQEFLYRLFNRDHSSIMRRYAVHRYKMIIPGDERVITIPAADWSGDVLQNEPRAINANHPENFKNSDNPENVGNAEYFCISGVHGGLPTIHSINAEILRMPSYPSAGCVRMINHIVVVKLSD